ncbi:hypothetical protein OG535_06590 [Kitasatospora sp. NBC_00085]|uniref:hypothetical protein n=1 Tax=unclassified Kitasatospora TaxID=2633591 RepID=UPI003253C2A1
MPTRARPPFAPLANPGLTAKHLDVDGLLAVTSFRAGEPRVLTPEPGTDPVEEVFPSPAAELRLSRLHSTGTPTRVDLPAAPQILLCTAGHARLHARDGPRLDLYPGRSAYLHPTGEPVHLTGAGADLFRATTGH